MVMKAASFGLTEKVFESPIYHQDHVRRYTYKAIEQDESFLKVYTDFQEKAQKMLRENQPLITNDKNWGVGNQKFEELIIG